jgi:uncharacterized membrane protein YfcA
MIELELWFMFPVAVVIASIAMMAGIGGAVLFSPFFILVLRLDPLLALASGLAIEIFGFTSGVVGYWRRKSIRFDIVRQLIILTLPATIVGVMVGRLVPVIALKIILGLLILFLAYQFLFRGRECVPKDPRCTGVSASVTNLPLTPFIRSSSLFGGLLVGMISAGLGETNELNFLQRLKLPVPLASGTSVFLVAASAIVGVATHAFFLVTQEDVTALTDALSIVVFAIPGVVIGAQIGVYLSSRVNPKLMGRFVGVLFTVLAVLTFISAAQI